MTAHRVQHDKLRLAFIQYLFQRLEQQLVIVIGHTHILTRLKAPVYCLQHTFGTQYTGLISDPCRLKTYFLKRFRQGLFFVHFLMVRRRDSTQHMGQRHLRRSCLRIDMRTGNDVLPVTQPRGCLTRIAVQTKVPASCRLAYNEDIQLRFRILGASQSKTKRLQGLLLTKHLSALYRYMIGVEVDIIRIYLIELHQCQILGKHRRLSRTLYVIDILCVVTKEQDGSSEQNRGTYAYHP